MKICLLAWRLRNLFVVVGDGGCWIHVCMLFVSWTRVRLFEFVVAGKFVWFGVSKICCK